MAPPSDTFRNAIHAEQCRYRLADLREWRSFAFSPLAFPMPLLRLFLLALTLGIATEAFASEKGVTFMAWNLQNYAPLPQEGRARPAKSEESAALVAEIIAEARPDLLGVCEMGPGDSLADLRRRLSAAGLDYPHIEWLEASDPNRHQALLSRFPIGSRQSLSDVPLDVNGTFEKMRRGLLDVTVTLPDGSPLRLIGVHFKSKMELHNENEALIRRAEAHHLRQHLTRILTHAPDTALLLYGDFNDTRDQIILRDITGERGHPTALTPLPLADPQGDRWTFYWHAADTYSRIDYVMASPAIRKKIDLRKSHLYRHPHWLKASDHRPLIVIFKPNAFAAP